MHQEDPGSNPDASRLGSKVTEQVSQSQSIASSLPLFEEKRKMPKKLRKERGQRDLTDNPLLVSTYLNLERESVRMEGGLVSKKEVNYIEPFGRKELDAHFDVVFMYRLISLGSDQLLNGRKELRLELRPAYWLVNPYLE
ncbi:hypothetical protein STAS_23178 [Striga asiatica]|uniref:Uncharacterized protein n=1 Tax=Striga asiatica TaxID=4170 RepID=A0A5A7QMN9_STRAF|nr:hypothetical protein STAS_23178 [Striga asiatica]